MERRERERKRREWGKILKSIRNDYQVLAAIPFEDSEGKLNPEFIKKFSAEMTGHVLEIMESIRKYEEGDPNPMIPSAAMLQEMINLLRTLKDQLKEARPNAGPTLARTFSEAMKEISNCSLDFLECAIAYGPYAQESSMRGQRLPGLSAKVNRACEAFLKMPRTNSMAIQASLQQVVNGVEGALHEIQDKAAEAGASSTSSAEGKQDEAMVKAVAICVETDAVCLVEQMISNVMIWNDRYEPGLIMSMESLLEKFIDLGDRIKQISNNLSPLRNVSDILDHLQWMKDFADTLKSEPFESGFVLKTTTTLKGSIQQLESVLKNPSPAQARDAEKQSAECQGPK